VSGSFVFSYFGANEPSVSGRCVENLNLDLFLLAIEPTKVERTRGGSRRKKEPGEDIPLLADKCAPLLVCVFLRAGRCMCRSVSESSAAQLVTRVLFLLSLSISFYLSVVLSLYISTKLLLVSSSPVGFNPKRPSRNYFRNNLNTSSTTGECSNSVFLFCQGLFFFWFPFVFFIIFTAFKTFRPGTQCPPVCFCRSSTHVC